MSGSRLTVGVVDVNTVVFHRATIGAVSFGNDAVDTDGKVIATIDGDGLLTYWPSRLSEITLAAGVVINGIRALYPNDDPIAAADYPARAIPMLLMRSADDGYATLVSESLTVADPTYRINNAYSSTVVTIGRDPVQLFWMNDGGVRRWRCPHWGKYVAGNPDDWQALPDTVTAALDALAAQVPRRYSGVTAVDGTYSVTYPTPYGSIPNVQVQLVGGTNSPEQFARLTSSTVNGFVVTTSERAEVNVPDVGLVQAAATSPVNGLTVNVAVLPV